jgi:hypothetical protein
MGMRMGRKRFEFSMGPVEPSDARVGLGTSRSSRSCSQISREHSIPALVIKALIDSSSNPNPRPLALLGSHLDVPGRRIVRSESPRAESPSRSCPGRGCGPKPMPVRSERAGAARIVLPAGSSRSQQLAERAASSQICGQVRRHSRRKGGAVGPHRSCSGPRAYPSGAPPRGYRLAGRRVERGCTISAASDAGGRLWKAKARGGWLIMRCGSGSPGDVFLGPEGADLAAASVVNFPPWPATTRSTGPARGRSGPHVHPRVELRLRCKSR